MDANAVRAALRKAGLENAVDADLLAERLRPAADEASESELVRDLLQWLDDQRAIQHLHVKSIPISDLTEWHYSDDGYFGHKDGRFFRIVGISVTSVDREVGSWDQPILENIEHGVIGLMMKRVNGRPWFLLQAKAEFGNRPHVQIGPTVQFTPGNYEDNLKLKKPFLYAEFVSPGTLGTLVYEGTQSEEGARFFQEAHIHRIIEAPADWAPPLPDNYRWFSIDAVRFFLHLGEEVNSCARSILACLL
jgi:oxidase EvaA